MGAGTGALDAVRKAAAALFLLALTGCSPVYVLKAGWAEAKILAAREPIAEVATDPATPLETRQQLRLVMDARAFAADSLGLDVGTSYTTFTRLESDTLAMVLSAAHRDRLVPRTWWFPIVGRVPYRGFFDLDDALDEQRDLEREGFDTYLRPTAAFSTLGWFSDPLLSTLLRLDDVELVETVLHELAHNHLYLPGHTTFNESFATFVGRVGAAEFFCRREGGGSDTVRCARARARRRDYVRFSGFLDGVVAELEALYGREDLEPEEKVARREGIFEAARVQFRSEVQPSLEATTFRSFLDVPLNNATLLARMRYYHRLGDFQALLERHGGDLAAAVGELARRAPGTENPFGVLENDGGRRIRDAEHSMENVPGRSAMSTPARTPAYSISKQ